MPKPNWPQKAPRVIQEVQVVWKLGPTTKEKCIVTDKKNKQMQILNVPMVLNRSNE